MVLIFLLVYLILFIFSPIVHQITLHPVLTVCYAVKDIYFYIRHKEYNNCPLAD